MNAKNSDAAVHCGASCERPSFSLPSLPHFATRQVLFAGALADQESLFDALSDPLLRLVCSTEREARRVSDAVFAVFSDSSDIDDNNNNNNDKKNARRRLAEAATAQAAEIDWSTRAQ